MPNFKDTFETRGRSFISAFSNYMTVPLNKQNQKLVNEQSISNCYKIFTLPDRKLAEGKFC